MRRAAGPVAAAAVPISDAAPPAFAMGEMSSAELTGTDADRLLAGDLARPRPDLGGLAELAAVLRVLRSTGRDTPPPPMRAPLLRQLGLGEPSPN